VARIVGVTVRTVRRWCRAELLGYRFGRSEWRIPRRQLDRARGLTTRHGMEDVA
jgi:excisionase family DNA binding protein